MSWSKVAVSSARNNAAGTSLDGATALNVQAGDLLFGVFLVRAESGSMSDLVISENDGTDSFTLFDEIANGTNVRIRAGYWIVGANDTSWTPRASTSASLTYRSVLVYQYRPDAGETVSVDATCTGNTGNSTTATSPNINTAGTDDVVIGILGQGNAVASTSRTIAGSAVDEFTLAGGVNYLGVGYKLFTSTQSNINFTATITSGTYVSAILAFKSEATSGLSGAIAQSQILQAQDLSAIEKISFLGIISQSQAKQDETISANTVLKLSSDIQQLQPTQSQTISGNNLPILSGTVSQSQELQTQVLSGTIVFAETFSGSINNAQAVQTQELSVTKGPNPNSGDITQSQAIQTQSINGNIVINISGDISQSQSIQTQTINGSSLINISGDISQSQALQTQSINIITGEIAVGYCYVVINSLKPSMNIDNKFPVITASRKKPSMNIDNKYPVIVVTRKRPSVEVV